MLCIQLSYKASQPSMNLIQSSGNEVKSKQKNSEQEPFFSWNLLAEKTRSNICFCGALTSKNFLMDIRRVSFQEKVQVTLHLIIINFCMPPRLASHSSIHRYPYRTC